MNLIANALLKPFSLPTIHCFVSLATSEVSFLLNGSSVGSVFAMARWSRYDLIAIDEVGYVPLAEVGAEFLFQVIAERAERTAVIVTTNLAFSEWTQVIPNARLCKALLDRITDRAHILETGTESYRFRRTLAKGKKGERPAETK